jgi:hypothetical protein
VTEAPVASAAPATSAAPTASAAPVASAAPSASATQIAVPSSYPPLDTTCATDDDCTSTGMWGDCCGACEQKYANKAYVPRVQAYCAAHPAPQCPPMGCSWGMSKPQCRAGHCQAWKK